MSCATKARLALSVVVLAGVGCTLTTSLDGYTGGPGATSTVRDAGGPGAEGGTCASIDTPDDCGACGHSCLGGACESRTCRPVVLARDVAKAWYLRAVGDDVFLTSQQGATAGVYRLPKAGGAKFQLTPLGGGFGLAVDDTDVFACDDVNGAVVRVPRAGGPAVPVLTGPCSEMVRTGDRLVVTRYDTTKTGTIRSSATDGSGVTTLLSGLDGSEGIATDGTTLFFAEGRADRVRSIPLAGGTSPVLGQHSVRRVRVDGDFVYGVGYASKEVFRVPKAGGAVQILGTAPSNVEVGGLAVDATHVYWVASPAGVVLRVPKSGGNPEIVLSNLNAPVDVEVDERAIYVTEGGAGQVLLLAK